MRSMLLCVVLRRAADSNRQPRLFAQVHSSNQAPMIHVTAWEFKIMSVFIAHCKTKNGMPLIYKNIHNQMT